MLQLVVSVLLPLAFFYLKRYLDKIGAREEEKELTNKLEEIIDDVVHAVYQEIVKPAKKQKKFDVKTKSFAKESAVERIMMDSFAARAMELLEVTEDQVRNKIEKSIKWM